MELEFLDDIIVENGRTANEFRVLGNFRNKQEDINRFCKDDLLFISVNGGFRRLPTEEEKLKKKTVVDLLLDWGDNQDSDKELLSLFDKKPFDYPKPSILISKLIKSVTYDNPDSIILDSFAGSGTTAHAVLNLNKQDGGKHKFILIEMEEYAENITAERVKRVMKGYGTTEGTGGSFDFYELGEPLFNEDGNLNETVGIDKIRQYVYYTETKSAFSETQHTDNKHFLGNHNNTAYYFNYEKDEVTTLDHAFLATMKNKAEQYIIYADNCLLTKDFMTKHHIIFKKIPRDLTRF